MADLCLRVDSTSVGELPLLTLANASQKERVAIDALQATFQTIPSWDTLPHATYRQLGLADTEHVVLVEGMIGTPLWQKLYGDRNVTPHHWVPSQVTNLLNRRLQGPLRSRRRAQRR